MSRVRGHLSASNAYESEWAEAKEQGALAVAAVQNGRPFLVNYDYWNDRPIKSAIDLNTEEGFPGSYRISARLPEVGNLRGFPDNLLSREYPTLRTLENGQMSAISFFKAIAAVLGQDPDQIVQAMFDDPQHHHFVLALNKAGHFEFDEVRSAIHYSGRRGYPVYSFKEQYMMLSDLEKSYVQNRRGENLIGRIRRELNSGSSSAPLSISLYTQGVIWYDPASHTMQGEITPSAEDAVVAILRPFLTPNSTHADLLNIRHQGLELTRQLGF